ncbi:MAG TPA: class I SAM-dependent methyltransferase [Pirellulales bacterium]|nr:class I SAM-dependent methyltransferase [Pirellulales bacterium]
MSNLTLSPDSPTAARERNTLMPSTNLDAETVKGFGLEWKSFDQSQADPRELESLFDRYFSIFPWNQIDDDSVGADVGCGSGRWSMFVAPRVGHLHLVDASPEALSVANKNLGHLPNVSFHASSVDQIPLANGCLDFAFSLGVLHHVPDTAQAICDVAAKLKPGAPLLLYLYYNFDNRPTWYRTLWRASDLLRRAICRLPFGLRWLASQMVAAGVYFPLARLARLLDARGKLPRAFPLAFYRNRSFYVMRTDALDRFGTRLEQRFSKTEIEDLMTRGGFERISFRDSAPYWCAVGYKK